MRIARLPRPGAAILIGVVLGALITALTTSGASAKSKAPQVLYVGTFHSIATPASVTFNSIQAAVDASKKGDWILIAPGDYRETDDVAHPPTASELASGWYGGVDISTPDLHLRGMDRNGVIVDGTSSGSACSSAPGDQNTLGGEGRNGILVWKAKGVSIDNLTVCNFLAGSGNGGNEIWWNGGAGSGKIGLKGYSGSYLTATSTYFANSDVNHLNVCATCALYGIFASNSKGPATLDHLYANNFSDSGMYVGACTKVCDVTISNATMENNALGYSGTNSGGAVVIENSTFDNNKDGLDTNTALTGDPPPPQDGRCSVKSAQYSGTKSCWIFKNNLVENNNNPNTPVAGTAGLGPTGTGMTISGGRNDIVTENQFVGNGAWGILFVPYPDANTTSGGKTCQREHGVVATSLNIQGVACLFDPQGDHLVGNQFSGNGTLGNPSNADFGNLLIGGHEAVNCFSGNTDGAGAATNGNALDGFPQQTPTSCGTKTPKSGLLGGNTDLTMLIQVECDAGVLSGGGCANAHYPQPTAVVMDPLPSLASMPNPCVDVPANLWCRGGSPA